VRDPADEHRRIGADAGVGEPLGGDVRPVQPASRACLVGQLVQEHDLVGIVEGFEDSHPPNSRFLEQVSRLANVKTESGGIVDDHDAGNDDAGRSGVGTVEIEPLDQLARKDGWQIVDTDLVEPLEERSGPQQFGDRFAGAQCDRHQHALGVGSRGEDEDVVRTERGKFIAASLQQRPHARRIGHAVIGGQYKRVRRIGIHRR
jgi:hypothetical protein